MTELVTDKAALRQPKAVLTLLSALSSKDSTRVGLTRAHATVVDGGLRLEASDGVRAVRLDFNPVPKWASGIETGFFSASEALTRLALGEPIRTVRDEFKFPNLDSVLVALSDEAVPCVLDAAWLGQALTLLGAVAKASYKGPTTVRVQISKEMARLDLILGNLRAVVVVMPMHEGPDEYLRRGAK